MRAHLCLVLGFVVWAAGCSKPQLPGAPATGNPLAGQLANSPPVLALAGNNASNTNAIISAGAGASAVANVAAGVSNAAVSGQGAGAMGAAGQAGADIAGPGSNTNLGSAGAAADGGASGAAGVGGVGGMAGAAGSVGGAGAGGAPSRPIAKFPIRNLIVGACEGTHAVPDPNTCTGWDELYECAARNCELAACEKICAAYIACAGAAPDACNVNDLCPRTAECHQCTLEVEACTTAPCERLFRCATPSSGKGGACERLNACCMKQTNPLACTTWVERAGSLLGDAGCQSILIDDPGFLKAYVNDPPCTP